jgi:hypothetical protein
MLKISFLSEMLLNHWVISNKNILFFGIFTLEDENAILSQISGMQLPTDSNITCQKNGILSNTTA